MCNYFKENNKMPCCTHDCDGCIWFEDDMTNDEFEELDFVQPRERIPCKLIIKKQVQNEKGR